MRVCRHVRDAFEVTSTVTNPGLSGLPPVLTLCNKCATEVFHAAEQRMLAIVAAKAPGKSGSAQQFGHLHSLLDDIFGARFKWDRADDAVKAGLRELLGDAFATNRAGELVVEAESWKDRSAVESYVVADGDYVMVRADGTIEAWIRHGTCVTLTKKTEPSRSFGAPMSEVRNAVVADTKGAR